MTGEPSSAQLSGLARIRRPPGGLKLTGDHRGREVRRRWAIDTQQGTIPIEEALIVAEECAAQDAANLEVAETYLEDKDLAEGATWEGEQIERL